MSSISLSLKMMLAASACAGLTLLACGDEGGSGDGDSKSDEGTGSKADAGKKTDAGKKDAGLNIPTAVEGEECDQSAVGKVGGRCDDDACDKAPCIAQCVDDVYGECKSATDLIGAIADSGFFNRDGGFNLPDTGLTRNQDGGFDIMIGDAKVAIPTSECPAEFECSTELGQYGIPDTCVTPGSSPFPGLVPNLPPLCETTEDCTGMGIKGGCQMFPLLSDIVGGKVCYAPCK